MISESYPKLIIRIIRIIFFVSYARILTYEILSYVNHVAKNTRSLYNITHLNDTELENQCGKYTHKSVFITAECRVLALLIYITHNAYTEYSTPTS